MKGLLVPAAFVVLLGAVGFLGVTQYGALWAQGRALPGSGTALPAPAPEPLAPGERVAFLELGSAGCMPCEAMKPVLEAVTRDYGDRVEVVYHDVRKDPSPAREHRIRLIPTQVFLLPDGTEFFRHEGYFPLEQVEEVLARMGVSRGGGKEGTP